MKILFIKYRLKIRNIIKIKLGNSYISYVIIYLCAILSQLD